MTDWSQHCYRQIKSIVFIYLLRYPHSDIFIFDLKSRWTPPFENCRATNGNYHDEELTLLASHMTW